MLDHRISLFAFFLAASCGEGFTATTGTEPGSGGTSAATSGRTTSSSSQASGGEAGSGAGSAGEAGAAGSSAGGSSTAATSSSSDGGSGGMSATFSASCLGEVDCPGVPACADWEYVIDDDGTTTVVIAGVTLPDPGMTCSDQAQYASEQDAGLQVVGNIMFPCDSQTWAFGIDEATELVYVKEMTMGYSWTPPCQ